jgi:SPP1 gp7 family putative phage head morphogenesis protein
MNFKPIEWFRRKLTDTDPTRNQGGGIAMSTRETQPMGAWSGVFGSWEPRSKSPWLLEAMREALPVLDGGINRLTTMDGIIEVEGGNDKLVQEIEEWMRNVPVNDLEIGYQAFYAGQGAEHYEQGIGVGEFIYDEKGRDVVGLRVADSKGIGFVRGEDRMHVFYRAPGADKDWRPDGLGTVEHLLRGNVRSDAVSVLRGNGYVELDPRQCVFALHRPEADNPYGTSILRSMPFVAQLLLKMENASGRAWERFGDPPFHVHYSTKNRKISADDALKRAKLIANDLAKALSAKSRGNSMDLATAAAADDDVKVDVIGAAGIALEIEMPARHMLEQVVAGFGLPPWMLGITWSQAAGIGEQQSVVVLQESETRFSLRKPGLERPISAMLRARGRTWKPGDWALAQRLPNLMDEAKRAQAQFLRAQTAMMLNESGQVEPPETGRGIDNNLRARRGARRKAKANDDSSDESGGETWAESDPELPKLEADTITAMLAAWSTLRAATLADLQLTNPTGDSFTFAEGKLASLLVLGQDQIRRQSRLLLEGQMVAWDRGVNNAAEEIPAIKAVRAVKASPLFDDPLVVQAIEQLRDSMRDHLARRGLELVTDGVARTFRQKIVAALVAGEFDGQNPINVANELRRRFDAGDYNWERLARSEIAMAQSDGKLDLYEQQGVTWVDYETADDSKVSAICRELEAAGPYLIRSAPIPVRDSHPNCRCTIRAKV